MRRRMHTVLTLLLAAMLSTLVSPVQAVETKVKVFVLAGQSNMEGHGAVRSLPVLGEHAQYGHLLKTLQNQDGSWAVRDDVTIVWKVKEKGHGPLTVGWGCEDTEIGPELMFGTIMGETYDAPDMPIVLGELGIGGHEIAARAKKYEDDFEANGIVKLRAAQKAVGQDPSLKHVIFVPTVDFWDVRLQALRQISDAYWGEKQEKGIKDTEENHLPTKVQNDEFLRRGVHWYCHYNGSSANYSLIGYALAQALNRLP